MFLDDIVGRMSVEEARMSGADKWRQHFDQETAPARAEFNKSTEHYNRLKTDPAYKEQQFKAWQEKIHGKKDVAENYNDEDDVEGESEIQNGSYVTDAQDSTGEVYRVSQYEPGARRCWIGDRDGRGWYISPDRLEMCNDPRKINQYFGKKEYDEDSWSSEKSVGTGDAWSGQSHEMVEAGRMSAAVKLQRAWEREQSKSTASRERADQAKAAFEREWQAKQQKEKQSAVELDEISKKSYGGYVPARLASVRGRAGLAGTDPDKAQRIVNKDIPRALRKLQDPKYDKKVEPAVAEDEGDAEGLPHLTRELLTHIVQQVGDEGAHAIVKSLEWGDGAARELLHLIVTDLKNNIEPNLDEHIGKVKGGFRLYSHKGKNLGTFPSKSGAEKHEREVQYFKHANESINEALNDASPVTGAITRRILSQRLDLLKQYGPELVGAAIDNVADYVGDVDEIGSSDVSAWVNQVERMLRDDPPEAFGEGVEEGSNDYFKRRKENAAQNLPSVLYHATYKPRLKSIKLKGLGAGGKRNWEDSQRGVVYLALDPNVAESYAETSDMVPDEWLDSIVILKIATAGLDPNKFHIDSNVQDNTGDTVEYHGIIPPSNISLYNQGVAEGFENLSYIGNCTDDDVIEYIFGDATNFAKAVEEHGDEFTIDDLVVKYDPESDIHSFYYKKQGIAEAKNLKKRVKIVKGPDAGKTGWIREIKHGAFKGAPKSYYIDLDDGGQANNLPATALRLAKDQGVSEGLNEFAPPGGDDGGDDGFSEETLKRLAAQWWNGDEDPRVEKILAAAGWEIGQDEGGYDNGGAFVVQAGDVNGNSYMSWPAEELEQGVAAGNLNELFEPTLNYYKLSNGKTVQVSYRPNVNQSPVPFTDVSVSYVNTALKPQGPSFDSTGVAEPWTSAPDGVKQAIQKFATQPQQGVAEGKQRLDPKCWTGKHKEGTKIKGGVRVNNCVPNEGISETPIDGPNDNPMIYGHQGVNPAELKTRMMRARGQLKDLAQRSETDNTLSWETITRQFPKLAMNIEQIRHAIAELAKKRKKGGIGARGIDPNIGEEMMSGNKFTKGSKNKLGPSFDSTGVAKPWTSAPDGVKQAIQKQGVAEETGSWIVYDPETRQIKKRFKTHTAGKSYAQTHGLGFASSEYYFDRVKGQEAVTESTNYWTKLQNERNTKLNTLVNELKENIK